MNTAKLESLEVDKLSTSTVWIKLLLVSAHTAVHCSIDLWALLRHNVDSLSLVLILFAKLHVGGLSRTKSRQTKTNSSQQTVETRTLHSGPWPETRRVIITLAYAKT